MPCYKIFDIFSCKPARFCSDQRKWGEKDNIQWSEQKRAGLLTKYIKFFVSGWLTNIVKLRPLVLSLFLSLSLSLSLSFSLSLSLSLIKNFSHLLSTEMHTSPKSCSDHFQLVERIYREPRMVNSYEKYDF